MYLTQICTFKSKSRMSGTTSNRERWATLGDTQQWIQLPNMDPLYICDTWYTRFWNPLSLSRPSHRERWATSGHSQRWIQLPNMDPLYFCDTWYTRFWNLLSLSRPSHRERWATLGHSQRWIQLPNMDPLYFCDTWYTSFWNLLSLSRPSHRKSGGPHWDTASCGSNCPIWIHCTFVTHDTPVFGML